MPYQPAWTYGDANGRLTPGVHRIHLADPAEIAAAVNRRHRLTFRSADDFSGDLYAGAPVRVRTYASAQPPPYLNLRTALASAILEPEPGGAGGVPASPEAMCWLWPEQDGDAGKVIVNDAQSAPSAGEVGLFDKLNTTSGWTDAPGAGLTHVRAVHLNELRRVVEMLRRGRWTLPLYLPCGLFSPLPDTPWIGDSVANNGADELRAVGHAVLRAGGAPELGLTNVTARDATAVELTADAACTVEVYRCLRAIDFDADPPTWNEYDPSGPAAWSVPGAGGAADATLLGSIVLAADTPGALTTPALQTAVQAMIDGGEQNFILRRADAGAQTIVVQARLIVEFDLDSPPN